MARLYSTLICHLRGLTGDSSALTPPPDDLWVVRDISVYNGNTLENVAASITGIDGVVIWSHSWSALGSDSPWQHQEGRWVVPAEGGFLQCHATFPVDFYVSGYALSLP